MEKVFSKTQRAESTCHLQIGLQQTKIEVSTKTSKKTANQYVSQYFSKGFEKAKATNKKGNFWQKRNIAAKQ